MHVCDISNAVVVRFEQNNLVAQSIDETQTEMDARPPLQPSPHHRLVRVLDFYLQVLT